MELRLLTFDGCPNAAAARAVLQAVAAARPEMTTTEALVDGPEHAEELGFHGSPSFLLDGVDLVADPDAPVAFACRTYDTPHGIAGCPTIDQLVAAIDRMAI